jgi:uncharacterized membrane protein YkoI
MDALSLFFFTRIDKIVHSDLYNYGLKFDYEWAGKYWANSNLLINSLIISIILLTVAAVSILTQARTRNETPRIIISIFLIAGITLTSFSLYLFRLLDSIVHQDLYQYGLQFSYEWAINYWTYAGLMLGLISFANAITIISITLVFLSARKTLTISMQKLISPILITIAAIALALSVVYSSSILAFIGLGLMFWGAILAYIQTEEYVKGKLLEATAAAPLMTLNQLLNELNYEGKAIYLPPKYLRDQDESRAYIPKQKGGPFPTPEQIQEQENKLFIKSPNDLLITPPGAELARLFEKTLETSFIRIDLQHFQEVMPKLFVEDLEIAKNVEITAEGKKILVKIEDSNYQNLTKEIEKFPKLYKSLGCPLSSAMACALAKVTGKPITIEKQQINEENKTIEIEYRIIEEEQT